MTAPSPQLVFDTLLAYQRSAALVTAIELDLFRAIADGPGDAASLGRQCGASERGTRILCDYLTVIGLLDKADGHYRNTPTSALFLDSQSPAYMGQGARFLCHAQLREPFQHLTEIVRTGRTVLPDHGTARVDNPSWVEFARSMTGITGPSAAPMAEMVLEGCSGPLRVLDIAAGHGLFGIAIAKRNPEARIVALDSAEVLAVARENAQREGVGDRYEELPGDAFEVDFKGPYDIVLLTNFLHHFDPPTCTVLLRKIRAAMRPGGTLAALDFVPNDDRVSPPPAASFSLVMLATTEAGDAYTLRELEAMYRASAFDHVAARTVPTGPGTVVTGRAV
ncbi:MAG TPA: methyltransferase type 12 [Solibacterales bacterium]|jgi:2-polyprenyl-3-methyl-5-hydroxy-6-metoxy-1,4-benzoquinol methylase|nr:methyltransferase type 12 [Bryobacterales bacterium]